MLLFAWPASAAAPPRAAAAGAQPLEPVVVQGSDGSYAVAAPGLSVGGSMGPVLAGPSVVWTTSDLDSRLLSVEQANPDGTTKTLYVTPRRFRGDVATALAASPERVIAVRDENDVTTSCTVLTQRCTVRSHGALLAGAPGGSLRRVVGVAQRFRDYRGCRRGTMSIEQEPQLSGDWAGYERRVACRGTRRRDLLELVVHNVRTGARRVLARTTSADGAGEIQLAGRLAAYRSPRTKRPVVTDFRTGAVTYAPVLSGDWLALGEDGTVVAASFRSGSFNARLGWTSPRAPRMHRLPVKTSIFSSEPFQIAKRRIAYVRILEDGYELAVTDLHGNTQTVARFTGPESLDDFAFDGDRIAWAASVWRPYAGRADDGLPYRCENGLRVLARAAVIEVHPVAHLTRMPATALPQLPVSRDPARRRPFCPRD